MAKNVDSLTVPQMKLLKTFDRLERKRGRSPTLRELGEALGYADHSGAQRMVNQLQAMGIITVAKVLRHEITPKGRKFL